MNKPQKATDLHVRLQNTEKALDELRELVTKVEREVVLLRADLERLRIETEQAVGAKLP
jgi:hypothetical protein